jgi:threonine 3-dehydrogenase
MLGIAKIKPTRGVSRVEFPKPVPAQNEALVKVLVSGICGSDLSFYNAEGIAATARLALPVILGHEFCGVVEAVGDKITKLQMGDRVAGETHVPCMSCYTCQTGNAHICPHQKLIGSTMNGSFAEYITVPEVSLRKVPDALTDQDAAMLEPLGVAVHAVRRTDVAGENVIVLGCGTIGLLSVAAARAFGAARVFATSHTPEKLGKALEMGADAVFQAADKDMVEKILSESGVQGIGTVIEMSGSDSAIDQGFQVLRPGGALVLAGVPKKPISFDAVPYSIRKEIAILGVFGRTLWETWYLSEMLLVQGKVETKPVCGNIYAAQDFESAFGEAFSGRFGRTFLAFER